MPIYEYKCKCGSEREVKLPFAESDKAQTCVCGEVMQRQMSAPNFVMKQYGRQMALDSLNAKGGGFPNGRYKAGAQQLTASGL